MTIGEVQNSIGALFSDLIFDEQKHLYYIPEETTGKLINLPSVSKLVESHAPKFNAEEILPFSARKASRIEDREVSVHELRHRWQTINKTACDLGHQTHDFMEHYTGIERPRTPQEVAGIKFFTDMSKDYDVIFREIRMHSRKYMYAGTDDLLLKHKVTGNIVTGDYKTNGDLFKNYRGETLFYPFDFLINCPYNKYQLQLSYYQIMLEEAGLVVDDRLLVYLKADGTYQTFSLGNYTTELRELRLQNLAA